MPEHIFTVGGKEIKVTLEEVGATGEVAMKMGESGTSGGGKSKGKAKGKTRKAGKSGKVSGYMKFSKEMRPQILQQNPELKTDVIAVARKIGEKWRGLSQEEKNSYN